MVDFIFFIGLGGLKVSNAASSRNLFIYYFLLNQFNCDKKNDVLNFLLSGIILIQLSLILGGGDFITA